MMNLSFANDATWFEDAQHLLPEMVALRRSIHSEPELGLQTPLTTSKVIDALKGLPLEFRSGPSTTGLVAVLNPGREGRRVLLRGDMDALPMEEEVDLPFASKFPGKMHACGHDSHTAMLVGAAHLLCRRRDTLEGSVLFMFEPGEEGYHGARHMIDDGLLDPLPGLAFALHVDPLMPFRVVHGRTGPLLASNDTFRVRVTGHGGHGAMPDLALDPIPVACAIVQAIQAMIARRVSVFSPAVVTVGKIWGGTTDNVIPETAELLGTIRTLSPETRRLVHEFLGEVVAHTAAAQGMTAAMHIEPGFPVTMCAPAAVSLARDAVVECFGAESWRELPTPIMGSEDFAYVLERVPGAMFVIGASLNGQKTHDGLHCGRMILDESVMAQGAALHAAVAERFLRLGFE